MGIINLPLYLISSLLIVIAPGPDFIYVLTRGVSQGEKSGVLSALGISVGLLVHTLLAALGLSAIVRISLTAYNIIKYAGAAYLIYLGLKTFFSKKKLIEEDVKFSGKNSAFHQGVLTNVFNPKAIITFMAFLPQFVDGSIKHPAMQFIILGLMLALIAVIWFSFIGFFAGRLGGLLKTNRIIRDFLKYISGLVFVMLGLRIVMNKE
jgi:Putative threonine efflux protein